MRWRTITLLAPFIFTSTLHAEQRTDYQVHLNLPTKPSNQKARFLRWVDQAASGRAGYSFAATDAAFAFRMTGNERYCALAVKMTKERIQEADDRVSKGKSPPVAGDSYLYSGEIIRDLALTIDTCRDQYDQDDLSSWKQFGDQVIRNIWDPQHAQWGQKSLPWSGWGTDNADNNYFFSFLEATAYWAIATKNEYANDKLQFVAFPMVRRSLQNKIGGGSLEGTGYGASVARLLETLRVWRDSTGHNLLEGIPYADDTITYWVHATVPTMDRYAPIGDLSRESYPNLFDSHRNVVLQARQLSETVDAQALATWWLSNISLKEMTQGFNFRHDILTPSESSPAAPTKTVHHAKGVGHMFWRRSWRTDSPWIALVAGPYSESHAHQDQSAFTLFCGDFQVVSSNIFSHSGIHQDTMVHNIVRFQNDRGPIPQRLGSTSSMTIRPAQNGELIVDGNFTAALRRNSGITDWRRTVATNMNVVRVSDIFSMRDGVSAIGQFHVPSRPELLANGFRTRKLLAAIIEPSNPIVEIIEMSSIPNSDFRNGYRIELSGSDRSLVVEFELVKGKGCIP